MARNETFSPGDVELLVDRKYIQDGKVWMCNVIIVTENPITDEQALTITAKGWLDLLRDQYDVVGFRGGVAKVTNLGCTCGDAYGERQPTIADRCDYCKRGATGKGPA